MIKFEQANNRQRNTTEFFIEAPPRNRGRGFSHCSGRCEQLRCFSTSAEITAYSASSAELRCRMDTACFCILNVFIRFNYTNFNGKQIFSRFTFYRRSSNCLHVNSISTCLKTAISKKTKQSRGF